jgi:hypothetical protein
LKHLFCVFVVKQHYRKSTERPEAADGARDANMRLAKKHKATFFVWGTIVEKRKLHTKKKDKSLQDTLEWSGKIPRSGELSRSQEEPNG